MINDLIPLFIVGHKRSGSTFLGTILNMHPEIFISNETDILWLLYQYYNDQEIVQYKFDGPIGLKSCLEKFGNKLDKNTSPYNMFCEIQLSAMSEGFMTYPTFQKPKLKYIGDQKPFQNADPKLVNFARNNFPNTKYIHLIRNPFDVISSCKKFGKNNDGGWMWKNKTKDKILKHWIRVESWIEKMKIKQPHNVYDLRYEDMIENPRKCLLGAFEFLGLDCDENIIRKIENSIIKKDRKRVVDVLLPDAAKVIMDKYNYEY